MIDKKLWHPVGLVDFLSDIMKHNSYNLLTCYDRCHVGRIICIFWHAMASVTV